MNTADSLKKWQRVLGNHACTSVQVYIKKCPQIPFCFREKPFHTIHLNSESSAYYNFISLLQVYYIILFLTTYLRLRYPKHNSAGSTTPNFYYILFHFYFISNSHSLQNCFKLFSIPLNIQNTASFLHVYLMEKN